ncbi:hypothetical protein L484_026567 [Morus notabilis]|uniref:Uncharacterized protein n=1 Tax=Morus notabilis TaxID=981085 RepID=W9QP79_9ROSA|nr:hypothetical protein L484_026567 [Morus notabilis]
MARVQQLEAKFPPIEKALLPQTNLSSFFYNAELKQFVIDGNRVVLSVSNPDTRVDDAEFEENEVYAIDIVTSTGDGKPKLLDEKQTTIYKRAEDNNYHLKMKASRFIFSEINQKFPIMPFTARYEKLRNEVQENKRRMSDMKNLIKQQQELIQKLLQ